MRPVGPNGIKRDKMGFGCGMTMVMLILPSCIRASSDGRRLYDSLMNDYNKLVRPVENDTMALKVSLAVKLTQLIDVDEVNQVVKTNVWLRQEWIDYRLKWDVNEYNGIEYIQILSDMLWTPDIVLYNNADGNYEITLKTRAVVYHTGKVIWEPPAIYRSYCMINVQYFPYDVQQCKLKFGTWSYDGFKIDLMPLRGYVDDNTTIQDGIDLSEYYLSIEWDITNGRLLCGARAGSVIQSLHNEGNIPSFPLHIDPNNTICTTILC